MLKLGVVLVLTGHKRERKANVNTTYWTRAQELWTMDFTFSGPNEEMKLSCSHATKDWKSLSSDSMSSQRKYWALNANLSKARDYAGSVQFSHSVMSDSLQPHGLQHARPPCPSQTPGAPKNKVWHCLHCFPIYFPWSDGTRCHDLHFLNVEFKANFRDSLICLTSPM